MTSCDESGFHFCANCCETLRIANVTERTAASARELDSLLDAYRDAVQATNKAPAMYFEELAAREKIKAAWYALQEEEQIAWAAGNKENDEKNSLERELEASRLRVAYWRKAAYGIHNESCDKTSCMEDLEAKQP